MPTKAEALEAPFWHALHIFDRSSKSIKNAERALQAGVDARREELRRIEAWEREHAGEPLVVRRTWR